MRETIIKEKSSNIIENKKMEVDRINVSNNYMYTRTVLHWTSGGEGNTERRTICEDKRKQNLHPNLDEATGTSKYITEWRGTIHNPILHTERRNS